MSASFWILVVFATITSLLTAWTLGANSNSPPFAPAIGANAISTMRAALLVGILAGAWMGAPRLLQATSREYAQLGARRSIAALVPGFIIAQVAIALGIPISFNNIIISGVIGGGLAAGSAGVSRRKIGVTIGFWLLTLSTSIGIGYGLYQVFSILFGIQ